MTCKIKTIVIDVDNDKKLRILQAKRIKKEQTTISYSRILNEVLRKGL